MYTDSKMLELLQTLKDKGSIRFNTDFYEAIGLKKQNLSRIKNGDAHFTPEHIRAGFREFGVNANWIFGMEDRMYFLKEKVKMIF